jgi:hypothetical protein
MRKHQQDQILELTKTLGEAHGELKRLLSAGQTEAFMRLLSDCQDGAAQIGHFIEQLVGEGTRTVALLEEYCELLYRAGVSVSEDGGKNDMNPIKRLQKQLIAIENSVRDELAPTRTEIVFLPYNINMWDSLESIWLAAKDDPSCDAYVVPIPYFELNPDGSVRLLRCDADKYPANNIPVTSWRDYDVEARHPDIVFTHYPYDDNASNARVHPDFYSERLRKYCDLLVHVPYFVSVDGTVDDYCARLPGVLYADHVIVESESVRQSYIGHYKKYDKEFGWKGRFGKAEDKFIALGSPKYDKVINSKHEDFELPDKWARLIRRPDGTAKKIVLYNTHMFTWIDGGEQYFKKIRSVFEAFRVRDDVVLWWRPHPNTEINFRTKCPQLLSEYYSVIREYKEAGFGIYDDTADLHRAIAWADAYYGDGSSLVEMFRISSKDVLLQNMACVVDASAYDRVRFWDFCDDGDFIWFSAFDTNGLYRYVKSEKRTEFVTFFQTDAIYERYRAVCKVDCKLYFAPKFAENIAVYDIERNTLHSVPIDLPEELRYKPAKSSVKCAAAHPFGKFIFLTPFAFGAIIRYDTETGRLDYFYDYIDELQALVFDENAYWFACGTAVGESIYLPAACANAVVEFDMRSCKSTVHKLGDAPIAYKAVCHDVSGFWLMHHAGDAVSVWQKGSGIVSTVQFTHKSRNNHISGIRGLILRIPNKGDLTCDLINPQRNNALTRMKLKLPQNLDSGLGKIWPNNDGALCCKLIDDEIYVYSTFDDAVCIFDEFGELRNSFNTEISARERKESDEYQRRLLSTLEDADSHAIYRIEDFCSLKLPYYIDYILHKQREESADSRDSQYKFIGKTIWEYLRCEIK